MITPPARTTRLMTTGARALAMIVGVTMGRRNDRTEHNMITRRTQRAAVAAAGTAALLAGVVGPAAAEDQESDGVTGKTLLVDYVQQVHDFPGPKGDKYKIHLEYDTWSVVAVETNGAAGDVDLAVYDDPAMSHLIETSEYPQGETDFVAFDADHTLGTHYPKVTTYAGTGAYGIELAHGNDLLGWPAQTISTTASDVVFARTTYLEPEVTYYFSATPSSNVDVDLFFFASDDAGDTWVQGREDAARSAVTKPAGVAERLSFRPLEYGWYGVVVTTQGGDGSFKLQRYVRGS